jgi:hypothetical protein
MAEEEGIYYVLQRNSLTGYERAVGGAVFQLKLLRS